MRLTESFAEQLSSKTPVCFQTECVGNDGPCPISRLANPLYRKVYTQAVTKAASSILSKDKNGLVYVGFAAGGRFQDLVNLVNILDENKKAKIDIHLIDSKYSVYVDALDQLGPSHEVVVQGKHIKYYQFIKFLRDAFPDAKLRMFVHSSSESYLQHQKQNKANGTVFITGSDFDDNECLNDYVELLKGANIPANIFLYKTPGGLISFSEINSDCRQYIKNAKDSSTVMSFHEFMLSQTKTEKQLWYYTKNKDTDELDIRKEDIKDSRLEFVKLNLPKLKEITE